MSSKSTTADEVTITVSVPDEPTEKFGARFDGHSVRLLDGGALRIEIDGVRTRTYAPGAWLYVDASANATQDAAS